MAKQETVQCVGSSGDEESSGFMQLYKPTHKYCYSVNLSLANEGLAPSPLNITRTDNDDGFNEVVYDFLTTCKRNDKTLDEYLLEIQPDQFGPEYADELLCLSHTHASDVFLFDSCDKQDLPIEQLKLAVDSRIVAWLKEHKEYSDDAGICSVFLRVHLSTQPLEYTSTGEDEPKRKRKRKSTEKDGDRKEKKKAKKELYSGDIFAIVK